MVFLIRRLTGLLGLACLLTPPAFALDGVMSLQAVLIKNEELPVDLPACLELVRTQNLAVGEQRAAEQVAHGLMRQAQVAFLPSLGASYNQNRFQGAVQVFGGNTVNIYRTSYIPLADVSLEIRPSQVFTLLAARRDWSARRLRLQGTLQQELARAAEDYYAFLESQAQLQNDRQALLEAEEQVRRNQARYNTGVGTKLDLVQAETQRARVERALIATENTVAQREQALLARLNLNPSIHLTPLDATPLKQDLVSPGLTSEDLLTQARAEHPVLKQLLEERNALRSAQQAARWDGLPTVTLRASISGVGPGVQDLNLTRFGAITAEMNLLENMGGAVYYRQKTAGALADQKEMERLSRIRQLESQTIEALMDSRTFAATIQTAQKEVALAEEAFRLADGRYQAGVEPYLAVITAQTALNTARNGLARAIYNYNRAQVRLVETLGVVSPQTLLKGWTPHG
jgi:outer membrane protein TolC